MGTKPIERLQRHSCPVCEGGNWSVFFDLPQMPVNVCIQWLDKEEALQCPKGDIRLAFCRDCGFIWNEVFDPTLLQYNQSYENSLFFSSVYRDYTNEIVDMLIDSYGIRNKTVLDIGCGKGDFLFQICKKGSNRGIGFDTSFEESRDELDIPDGVEIIRAFYSERYADRRADLICSRFVFEHIEQPKKFLDMIRKGIGGREEVLVFFEVPDVSLILSDLSVWDIIYEHCSYFSVCSLESVFRLSGFDVVQSSENYDGQIIAIAATPTSNETISNVTDRNELASLTETVDSFVDNNRIQIETWNDKLTAFKSNDKRVVLWGAGAKGVSFLNMLKITDGIDYVVDINPHKHARFIPGTGQEIVGPEFLRQYKPDTIILMNPIYKNEIGSMLNDFTIDAELVGVRDY